MLKQSPSCDILVSVWKKYQNVKILRRNKVIHYQKQVKMRTFLLISILVLFSHSESKRLVFDIFKLNSPNCLQFTGILQTRTSKEQTCIVNAGLVTQLISCLLIFFIVKKAKKSFSFESWASLYQSNKNRGF